MERRSRRDPTEVFTAGPKFAIKLFEMLRKQYQGTELSVPEDMDICAYSIQQLLEVYCHQSVNLDQDPVWRGLSVQAKRLFPPLLESRYCIRDITPLVSYPTPVYGSQYGKTFQDWCNNFVLKLYNIMVPSRSQLIIRFLLPTMVRSLPIATYILPYVTCKSQMLLLSRLNYFIHSYFDSF